MTELLTQVASGKTDVETAASRLQRLPFEDIEFAHIDHHRGLRKGFPEVIFGEGKTPDQIAGILKHMLPEEETVLVTRVDTEKAKAVAELIPQAVYMEDAGMLVVEKGQNHDPGKGKILVVTAGTSDIPVAMEAYYTAYYMGNQVETIFDVGVAGIHRLFEHREALFSACVLIVVAGMEGALPSVVAGLVDKPVIAVPTSVGYGVSLGGMTALFAMLNSCSSNVAVVNIDNGFGAGYMASMINRKT